MTANSILLTGGTGRTGRRIADRLRAEGHSVRIAGRTTSPRFDWNESTTWAPHLAGATAVYLCFSPDLALPGADRIVAEFSAAAAAAGVSRLVLLSGRGEDGAKRCEDIALAEEFDTTVLRCAWFAQNFSEHFLAEAVVRGHIELPVTSVAEPFVDLDDVADIAARALTTDRYADEVLELTGPRALTFAEATAVLGGALGRNVTFETVSTERFVDGLVHNGMHRAEAEAIDWLFAEVLDGRNQATTDAVQRVLGRPARSFEDFAKRSAHAGIWNTLRRTP
ncbi:uncharacterized protein YbjT (DUF2867 family) [Tamaricihabitans halophyticus]|uniref:Uncharacterized protein YbjT (DUF2867 family) n=1 Tax=Tamaricihabitans halophyticus TaxID=1262583 RepID=A0A4R2QSL9_9PSEU|nr:NAD(P)H-binding protein [Tamaricihabitans halophyticus]TCP51959.1 uncharacterized protein YbjT (DUF2867 family) [Tamaricihabitans halophyticus]